MFSFSLHLLSLQDIYFLHTEHFFKWIIRCNDSMRLNHNPWLRLSTNYVHHIHNSISLFKKIKLAHLCNLCWLTVLLMTQFHRTLTAIEHTWERHRQKGFLGLVLFVPSVSVQNCFWRSQVKACFRGRSSGRRTVEMIDETSHANAINYLCLLPTVSHCSWYFSKKVLQSFETYGKIIWRVSLSKNKLSNFFFASLVKCWPFPWV